MNDLNKLRNPLAERLKTGQLGLALILKEANTPSIALAAATCGYDAIYFDLQHTTVSLQDVAHVTIAALGAGVTPIARVAHADYATATLLLEAGVQGIVFPDVGNAEEARLAASHCRFSPRGERSSTSTWPQFFYRQVPAPEARQIINDTTLVIVMVESPEALEQVDEIAAVPGVDIVHIGCGDMAAQLGVPGQQDHPRVVDAVERVVAACRKHNRIAGLGGLSGGDPARYQKMIALGPRFVTAGNEWALMMSAARARSEMLREIALG